MAPPIPYHDKERKVLQTPGGSLYDVLKRAREARAIKLTEPELLQVIQALPVQRVSLSVPQLFLILGGIASVMASIIGGGYVVWSKLDERITVSETSVASLKTDIAILKSNHEDMKAARLETNGTLNQIRDSLTQIKVNLARFPDKP